MSITRDQLELAALAAGVEIVCALDDLIGPGPAADAACGAVLLRGVQQSWRPHLDDGDSRRLQVKLRISLEHSICPTRWIADHADLDKLVSFTHDGTLADSESAARKAVVLCAAAVGERMRKGGA